MHLKRVKGPKREKEQDGAGDQFFETVHEEMESEEGAQSAEQVKACGSHAGHEVQQMEAQQTAEEELSRAMEQLQTTHFVPRSVQMKGRK